MTIEPALKSDVYGVHYGAKSSFMHNDTAAAGENILVIHSSSFWFRLPFWMLQDFHSLCIASSPLNDIYSSKTG